MALVDVEHGRLETERGERAHTADPEEQLLADPVLAVARVEGVREQVDVEQVERDGRRRPGHDVVAPHVGRHRLAGQLHLDRDRFALQSERLGIDRRIGLGLPAVGGEPLGEVPAAIEEPDPDEGQSELRGGLQMVAGEDAEAARVDRQVHVDAELHAEVGDEDVVPGVRACPPPLGRARRLLHRVQDRDEASESWLARSRRAGRTGVLSAA